MYASRTVRRKHVLREMWEYDFAAPGDGETIVQVLHNRANNLHEVKTPKGEVFLVSMPKKFRRLMWIRHSMYVIISSISEGKKVRGEIVRILNDDLIAEFAKKNIWPSEFADALSKSNAYPTEWEENRYRMPSDTDSSSDDELSADEGEGKREGESSSSSSAAAAAEPDDAEEGGDVEEGDDGSGSDETDYDSDSEERCCCGCCEGCDDDEEDSCTDEESSGDSGGEEHADSDCESGNECEDECGKESRDECGKESGDECGKESGDESGNGSKDPTNDEGSVEEREQENKSTEDSVRSYVFNTVSSYVNCVNQ